MEHPNLLVGLGFSDDGAVYRVNGTTALVQTVDFFSPIVDDPRDFGAIAAANALSDVYAMGGRPVTALSLICFPYRDLEHEILRSIVRGGAEKIAESGALVVGGHSVADAEIKFGYAVTGVVDPEQVWSNHTPRVGDALVLTKPLGIGLIATAVRRDKLPASSMAEPIAEMRRLNREAVHAAAGLDIHAATDVTGFGLLGHLCEMLRPKGLGARLRVGALNAFEGVLEAVRQGAVTAAHKTNRDYVEDFPIQPRTAFEAHQHLLFDPQTSGGLLFALDHGHAETLMDRLIEAGHKPSMVGEVIGTKEIQCV